MRRLVHTRLRLGPKPAIRPRRSIAKRAPVALVTVTGTHRSSVQVVSIRVQHRAAMVTI
ncbi:UNVERIFIED_CONTAM: hypothetical protein GTU68_023690 [Idotea baltica]|nr:hypothetical protein [Idotea baltica]